jgi:fumarate hydratase subunit alpha
MNFHNLQLITGLAGDMEKREIQTERIKAAVIELVRSVNFRLPAAVKENLTALKNSESSETAINTLDILIENARIAESDNIPLCQDCGVSIVFIEIGQDVSLSGPDLNQSINAGVEEAYRLFYLRKSVVSDPLNRKNTGTNTPCFIHTDIIPGDRIRISLLLKGGGSENMTALKMFRPTAGPDDIIDFIVKSVVEAGSNPCPPLFLGVGIGGTADIALLNSKKAVMRGAETVNPDPYYAGLEKIIMERLNATNIGPLGFGGRSTAGGVYIMTAPCHIASLPVALNLNCHSLRFGGIEI